MAFRIAALSFVLLTFVGCGEPASGIKTVQVSGTIYLDDKPLDAADVFFLSANHAANGKTDAAGKYTLAAGAEPGENKVYLSKLPESALNGLDRGQLEAQAQAATQEPKALPGEMIPAQYANVETTPLKFTVPPTGAKEADFKLKSN